MKKILLLPISILLFTNCSETNEKLTINNKNQQVTDLEQEKKAIMEVIKLESKAYRAKDYQTWQNLYIHEEHIKNWGYWEGYDFKVVHYDSWDDLLKKKREKFEGEVEKQTNEKVTKLSDLNVQIRSNVAWATYKQTTTFKETKNIYSQSLETRILEKINGSWKLAYVNFLYLPKETKSTAQ